MAKVEVLDHGFVRLVDSMGSDLSIVRAARVSYDAAWRTGENEGSDHRLIRYLWHNHHTTPFESVTLTFEVKAPIFVFRQWHRHRTWCLSGDTFISFELPDRIRAGTRTAKKMRLDDLYRKWQPTNRKNRPQRQTNSLFPRSRIQKMLLRVFDERAGAFTVGHIADVIASGTKQVFEIELGDGKKLKCSKDHRLLTDEGWKRLEDAIGLVVHGQTAGMTLPSKVMTTGDRAQCRARGQTLRAMSSEVVSVRLIGEEPTYDLSIAGDHHNFVANGMIVHNSFNELSARYRELPEEFYVPEPNQIGVQSKDNKQGRTLGSTFDERQWIAEKIREQNKASFATYRELLVADTPRELARSVLPVATYSHMFATVSLLNLFRFLTLRCDAHAQYEIRVYADAMRDLARTVAPVAVAAWEGD